MCLCDVRLVVFWLLVRRRGRFRRNEQGKPVGEYSVLASIDRSPLEVFTSEANKQMVVSVQRVEGCGLAR